MKRLVIASLLAAATLAGGARADTFAVVPAAAPALPSTEVPNDGASLLLPPAWTVFASRQQSLSFAELKQLWQSAGAAYGIPWELLASINKIESDFGRNMGPSSAGAVGWMQFMPSTWLRWGLDASGDGFSDPWNPHDAVYAAARYLAAAGATEDLRRAVFAYNHADWYVDDVLELAGLYGQGIAEQLDAMQAEVERAELAVATASEALQAALERQSAVAAEDEQLFAQTDELDLLSDRLEAQQAVVQEGVERGAELQAEIDGLRAELAVAEASLAAARDASRGASFAPGADSLLGAPLYSGEYVFPVGGGPSVVSVGHQHHDYPAADIAAPYGAPVYALTNAIVLDALHESDVRCGLGVRLLAEDGLQWQYCHLAYLDPTVQAGVALAAGAPVGLVGSTGESTGPHLHLALKPETYYPQDLAWFAGFAGTAFTWQDAATPEPLPANGAVFAVLPSEDDIVLFTSSP